MALPRKGTKLVKTLPNDEPIVAALFRQDMMYLVTTRRVFLLDRACEEFIPLPIVFEVDDDVPPN